MKFASVREISQHPSRFVDMKEPVIITKRGKPLRAMISMDEEELEDFILAQHLGLEGEIEKALRSSSAGKNIPSRKLREHFKKQIRRG
ncbi:MAG: hypothetical protein Q7T11_09090 [Deltaproteobacteria bacterium]|nr:hypothetical protein [Deltaproteobacteria bacterium]